MLRSARNSRKLAVGTVVAALLSLLPVASARAASGNPVGRVESVAFVPGGARVTGWGFDPDAPTSPLRIWFWVDHRLTTAVSTGIARPDVARQNPGAGPATGFALTLRLPAGRHHFDVAAQNIGPGATTLIGGGDVTVTSNPIGRVESVAFVPGGARVTGWAFDPDAPTSAVRVWFWVDHQLTTAVSTALARPDIAQLYPGVGGTTGFSLTIPLPEGRHHFDVAAQNIGPGATTLIGGGDVAVIHNPQGQLDAITPVPGGARLTGWAYDPDQPATPLRIWIWVDGTLTTSTVTGLPRAGTPVANAGFSATLMLPEGPHTFAVAAGNVGPGVTTLLGGAYVTLRYSPLGTVDDVHQVPGGLYVGGWTFDPDAPTQHIKAWFFVDGRLVSGVPTGLSRPDVAVNYPQAGSATGFGTTLPLSQGKHSIIVVAGNIDHGSNTMLLARVVDLNFDPTTSLAVIPTSTGMAISGWSVDPDTTDPVTVTVTVDGKTVRTVVANQPGGPQRGHAFAFTLNSSSGTHTVCANGANIGPGDNVPHPACQNITLSLSPLGSFESLGRAADGTSLTVVGWALDPDAGTGPTSVAISVDGAAPVITPANVARSDVANAYPGFGSAHGFAVTIPSTGAEHRVCVQAVNVGGGSSVQLGCLIVWAVNATAPAGPTAVTAQAGYGGATVSWTKPSSDGGAPITGFVVTASPGGLSVTVPATTSTATVVGLSPATTYTFAVTAQNGVGTSAAGTSNASTTQAAPPAQTTPAPISTSRYIRNIGNTGSATDLATMRSEGATDAYYNPSGHGYLILLDIGGQDDYDGGVVLSATTTFVSYANLVSCLKAYVDGYASKQNASAPVTIAIGTNNDMDVTSASGRSWALNVVNPVVAYAAKYPGITIAGANDIEPGFRGTFSATQSWTQGYLAATKAPFVFNGSADGCSWTTPGQACNNGWTMSGLYSLAGGIAPTRILNLPQVYNNTMAAQWKYISLTGVGSGSPRINFAGSLTEWTACDQAGGCFSITGNQAWTQLWNQLQSDTRLKVGSLPYSTDLRIDR